VQTPLQTMKTFLFLALVGFAAAECPNACSGHGTCGAKDSCSCYQNYQGNDCSERTCYFGIAHVDSPKGDLNADGIVSGALTTVVTGSEVYPWGTTEQFPNTDANEGHFYMECSNKGICDRKSGECDCFDGYTGTACARAACPNDCSGHGTCESIKELAEMRSFDTNEHDVPTTRVAGSSAHHSFDSAIEESYSYNLWDQDKTMGCKCDPVYYGADCSLKKCKYGVDPLFYDHEGVIRQTTVVHVGSKGKPRANQATLDDLQGSFKIVFYDVFGEKYVTKSIAAKGATAETVKLALQALPNGVISKNNQDVTAEQPNAVTVSAQTSTNAPGVDQAGGIGGGSENSGAGLGTIGNHGSEYTITFKTNPGVLKSIEIDTRAIKNLGRPDYWVANARQGQFSSRYTQNLGRIQVLQYGSKHLYTNTDLTSGTNAVAANALVKVGGQEFRVTTAASNKLILDEPYLGASIQPVTVNTGMIAQANSFVKTATSGASPAASDRFQVLGDARNADVKDSLAAGAAIYINDCAMTVNNYDSSQFLTAPGAPGADTQGGVLTQINHDTTPFNIGVVAEVDNGHDCALTLLAAAAPVQRRSDDTANQNVYKTTADTAAGPTTTTVGLSFQRGSATGDITTSQDDGNTPPLPNSVDALAANGGNAEVTEVAATSGAAQNDKFYFHTYGPFSVDTVTTASKLLVFNGADNVHDLVGTFGTVATIGGIHMTTTTGAADAAITTGKALLIGGRRYRVKAVSGTSITLSETFAGGQLRQVCAACIASQGTTADGTTGEFDVTANQALSGIPAGALVGIGVNLNLDNFASVRRTVEEASPQVIKVGKSANRETANFFLSGSAVNTFDGTGSNPAAQDLYMIQGLSRYGYSYSIVTENAGTTYQYVAQCSNRGSCDASTGLCKCFKGYSNDNCDTQNMLAA